MLESKYDVTIAPPTASDRGTNRERTAPCMMNDGMNTERMQKSASSRGTAVSMFPCRTARDIDGVCSIWVWMFSISTVASSTRMPIARARPPSVMMLIVLPVKFSTTIEPRSASGILSTTTITARRSRRNRSTMRPGQPGAEGPLDTDALDRAIDDRRLIELVRDLHVIRQGRLEPANVLLSSRSQPKASRLKLFSRPASRPTCGR